MFLDYFISILNFKKKFKLFGSSKNIMLEKRIIFGENVIIDVSKGGKIKIGNNCYVQHGSILSTFGGNITIGNNCSINPYCVLYGHGGLTIGDEVRIATHSIIIPANHIFDNIMIPIYKQGLVKKGITIKNNVWIGAGCKILDGVTIEEGCIIAAGAVVNKDTIPFGIYAGVPSKLIKIRNNVEKTN